MKFSLHFIESVYIFMKRKKIIGWWTLLYSKSSKVTLISSSKWDKPEYCILVILVASVCLEQFWCNLLLACFVCLVFWSYNYNRKRSIVFQFLSFFSVSLSLSLFFLFFFSFFFFWVMWLWQMNIISFMLHMFVWIVFAFCIQMMRDNYLFLQVVVAGIGFVALCIVLACSVVCY